jgi:hypothetical protein
VAAALRDDVELLEVGVERAGVERWSEAKRSEAKPSGPSPAKRTVTSPLSIKGAARSAITSAPGVGSSNSALKA